MITDDLPVWPVSRLETALATLSGANVLTDRFEEAAERIQDPRQVEELLRDSVMGTGHEIFPIVVPGRGLDAALRSGPQLVVVWMGVLVLESANRHEATLIAPDGSRMRVSLRLVADAVRELWALKLGVRNTAIASHLCDDPVRAVQMERELREVQLSSRDLEVGWALTQDVGAPLGKLFAAGRYPGKLVKLVGIFAILQLLVILSWVWLARTALSGWGDPGTMIGWCLCIATTIALRIMASWREGALAIELGALLKRRLMSQSSRAKSGNGMAHAMGRVLEAEVLEEFSLSGGGLCLLALTELAFAFVLLCQVHWLPPLTYLLLLGVLAGVCMRFYRRTAEWTDSRLRLTHWLIQRLVGFKTAELHGDAKTEAARADQLLVDYLSTSERKDTWSSYSIVLLSRLPLIFGFLSLLPIFLRFDPGVELWTGIGGVLLAQAGYFRLATGIGALCESAVAAKRVLPSSEELEPRSRVEAVPAMLEAAPFGTLLVQAREVDFSYPQGRAVLQDLNFEIRAGERLLLQGPSGSGKSTMASLLAGAEQPTGGLLLLRGMDMGSLGAERWRSKILSVSQFHQNHILQGSLGFNLLMGRAWPASAADLEDAREVCVELGLGALLERMPDGLDQTVGTTGWQLSHGERTRVYLARALLQSPDLIVLDESFASLDHETVRRVMACVDRRAATLLVIAHP